MDESGFKRDFSLSMVAENKDDDAQYQASLAVIDVFDSIRQLHKAKADLEELKRIGASSFGASKCTPAQFRIRFPNALRGFFRDRWNVIDVLNYTLFCFTVVLRLKTLGMIPGLRNSIAQLNIGAHMWSTHIDFQTTAFINDQQFHVNSLNAILTWLKVFKFLDHKPEMSILQRTLGKASGPLGWFLCSFFIVLLGSSQGFYMAFGLDIYGYRSTVTSTLSLLRMAVGDFDYGELEGSQQLLGPVMFFVYIVLVFFVMMSMFIALISEAYDSARDEVHFYIKMKILQ